MCARYYLDRELYDDIEPIVGEIQDSDRYVGDVRPTDRPFVITATEKPIVAYDIAWGYPAKGGKGLLINARAETITEKPTFRNGIHNHRCVMPARGFYEWDRDKNKVTFFMQDRSPIFLAGCYDEFQGERRFTIITTEANDSMLKVHDRMPLMIEQGAVEDWLLTDRYKDMLRMPMPELDNHRDYEQLTLDVF